ncbi:MAG: 5-oxoprolinase subunit PxpA [Alphaproteobacteria bacterium]|nr:5-oxoprolinase subunit PxpA [Alphaproteobacteria bacterium]
MSAASNAGHVNINADLGESFGPWVMGNDADLLKIVRSANVACGFHASDPTVMVQTVKLCVDNGVSVGAHPGFPDLQGFGRRAMKMTAAELEACIAYQLGALQAIAAMHGTRVTHIKPHGMMGNMSAEDADMSDAIARATRAVDREIIFLAQANSEQGRSARKYGLRAAEEVFADRTYTDAGFLTPRKEANAMVKDPVQAVANVRRMIDAQAIFSTSGKRIPCQVDSVCVHGDGPTALALSSAVRNGLESAGIRVVPLPDLPVFAA